MAETPSSDKKRLKKPNFSKDEELKYNFRLPHKLQEYERKFIELQNENGKLKYELKQREIKEVSDQSMKANSSQYSQEFSCAPLASQPSNEMTFKTPEGIVVKVYVGNILNLNVEAIVNAANENLMHGGGVADVISRAAGYKFQQESDEYIRRHGPISVGECCTTTAGNLQYKYVIHAVGPKWFDYPQDKRACAYDLKRTIESCFYAADALNLTSVALPAISSGRSYQRRMVDHMQVGVINDGWWITCRSELSTTNGGSHAGWSYQRRMVDHMQVGVINDGWWITCRSELSTTNGGSHAGRSSQRRMVDHMHIGVLNDGWWITCRSELLTTDGGSHGGWSISMNVGVMAVLLNDGNWQCR
ncbi:Uncharacterized protein SSO2899,Uncharacterized protein Saci_1252 [Mytilus edulis]|uniref:Uncharacterized protein SSO2899,Uncharacterized protein Saci_1252 n=1 Tax=Mytilus edulis TaxID=6550 RepID=A0A8S3V239_MYTED|nr:Uncharacterized protein SSO2899,Uncharacterized protein Saci_1252 [Mytilus edulis]